ncbi:class I adenylate-forming enzyme family protein [Halobellus rarus]|uniref:Class I adenylate-forming enzyme family protein n=1 Tax=Halobellus rarus TaxID=1126237 RepID=A0ABD6CRD0_9EURY
MRLVTEAVICPNLLLLESNTRESAIKRSFGSTKSDNTVNRSMSDNKTLKHKLNNISKWHPKNTAFVQAEDERQITYQEANRKSKTVANAISDLGVNKGDRVAFVSKTTIDHAIAFFGVQKLGAISATIHSREAPAQIRDMVRSIDPQVVIFEPEFAETVRPLSKGGIEEFLTFDNWGTVPDFAQSLGDLADESSDNEPDVSVSPKDPAFINFTSGSTGDPKGIVHTHSEVIESAQVLQYAYCTRESDSILNQFGPEFIAWYNPVLAAINVGAKLVLARDWDPSKIVSLINEEEVSISMIMPTQWKMLFQENVDTSHFSSLRLAGYAGEALSQELAQQIREEVTDNLFNAYGSTEIITGGAILLPHQVTDETLLSIGHPVPNTEIRIIEPNSKEPNSVVENGEAGELIVRGPTVANEVWTDSSSKKETFHEDGWWFSGDLAEVSDDGLIYLKGRADNLIISGGINVYPAKIEGVVEEHPDVIECAVVGIPHEKWTETPKAFVRLREEVSTENLDKWCRESEKLGNYQRPREWEVVENMPRTNTNKVDRASLQERDN